MTLCKIAASQEFSMRKNEPVRVIVENQQAILDGWPTSIEAVIRARIAEALADPRPAIPAEEVFRRLEQKARTSGR
jgi:hypothetical protein